MDFQPKKHCIQTLRSKTKAKIEKKQLIDNNYNSNSNENWIYRRNSIS